MREKTRLAFELLEKEFEIIDKSNLANYNGGFNPGLQVDCFFKALDYIGQNNIGVNCEWNSTTYEQKYEQAMGSASGGVNSMNQDSFLCNNDLGMSVNSFITNTSNQTSQVKSFIDAMLAQAEE